MALTIIKRFNIQHTKNIIQAEYIFTIFVRHEVELNVKDLRKLHLLLFYGELTMLKQRTYRSRSLEPAVVFSAKHLEHQSGIVTFLKLIGQIGLAYSRLG